MESRLSDSPALEELTFLRRDETNSDNVVLVSRKRGSGTVRCSFQAEVMNNTVLRRQLDREIDHFVNCCTPDPEVSRSTTPP